MSALVAWSGAALEGGSVASLEDRVTALESLVDQLAQDQRHSTDIAVTAAREALTAREAHQKNIELLNALRKTQAEHTHRLDRMDERFDRVDGRLDRIDGRLDRIDGRQDTMDGRLDRIEGSLGVLTVGVHSIESLLSRLVDESDDSGHS
jgi:chromosome segregation ATPase